MTSRRCTSRLLAGDPAGPVAANAAPPPDRWQQTRRYLPTLVRAAGLTLVLSCLAMALAVAIGVLIASGRVYGGAPVRLALTAYVELMRGTPILLQLFVIYYGLAAAIRLPAFLAALAGLALNYAAYESEIYRGALEAVATGQLEAARTLGFTERQILTLVRGPQAFRLALAPMTNDFVALLKDSSLVSVLTVVELTKQTQIFAANIGSWVIPGSLCAALYLAMSLPLSAAGPPARAALEGADRMTPLLDVRGVGLRRGSREILREVTFSVAPGSLTALMGPSGSGKTTMLRAVAGLERFDAGTIAIDGLELRGGRPLSGLPLRRWRERIGMVFQFHHLFEHLTALENVTLAPVHVHGVDRAAAGERARELLGMLGVEHRADALPRELSGGEAQRVAIARALAMDPPLLMMDEPTASLDPTRRRELGELLRGLAGRGRSILISTHDEGFTADFATAVLTLHRGAIASSAGGRARDS